MWWSQTRLHVTVLPEPDISWIVICHRQTSCAMVWYTLCYITQYISVHISLCNYRVSQSWSVELVQKRVTLKERQDQLVLRFCIIFIPSNILTDLFLLLYFAQMFNETKIILIFTEHNYQSVQKFDILLTS